MLEIIQPAFMTSLQDAGRYGYQRYGVPPSGPMDWLSHMAANMLVGNSENAACLELGISDAIFQFHCDAIIALTGAGYELKINSRSLPSWTSLFVRKGSEIEVLKVRGGNWAYLAVNGGFNVPYVLGSQSSFLRANLGLAITSGSMIDLCSRKSDFPKLSGRQLPVSMRPVFHETNKIKLMHGLHEHCFTAEALQVLCQSTYSISLRSDRMGLRLLGTKLDHAKGADVVSHGMVLGSVQVPADGQPIVMMPDHPTTGGYTQIAVVTKASMPYFVQSEPGLKTFQFTLQSVEEAQQEYLSMYNDIYKGLCAQEEDWLFL